MATSGMILTPQVPDQKEPCMPFESTFIGFREDDVNSEHMHCHDVIHTSGPFPHICGNRPTILETSRMVPVESGVIPDH